MPGHLSDATMQDFRFDFLISETFDDENKPLPRVHVEKSKKRCTRREGRWNDTGCQCPPIACLPKASIADHHSKANNSTGFKQICFNFFGKIQQFVNSSETSLALKRK